MRKIVASLTDNKNSQIAENAARAPYFLVFEDDKLVKVIKNPFIVWWGAWFAVAQLLKDEEADVFVAKKVWPNLERLLNEYWIKIKLK